MMLAALGIAAGGVLGISLATALSKGNVAASKTPVETPFIRPKPAREGVRPALPVPARQAKRWLRSDTLEARPTPEAGATEQGAAEQELTVLQELRQLAFEDPERSVSLTERLDERFPNEPRAPERAWYQARNLVYLGRFDEAQQIARETVEQHPQSSWGRDLARHLLSHPLGLPPRDHFRENVQ